MSRLAVASAVSAALLAAPHALATGELYAGLQAGALGHFEAGSTSTPTLGDVPGESAGYGIHYGAAFGYGQELSPQLSLGGRAAFTASSRSHSSGDVDEVVSDNLIDIGPALRWRSGTSGFTPYATTSIGASHGSFDSGVGTAEGWGVFGLAGLGFVTARKLGFLLELNLTGYRFFDVSSSSGGETLSFPVTAWRTCFLIGFAAEIKP